MAPDIGDLPLPDLVRYLLDAISPGISFDRAAALADNAVPATTIQRLADPTYSRRRPPERDTLVNAGPALRTTPWALYVAAGISLDIPGRPDDKAMGAVPLLPAGWHSMPATAFGVWRSTGEALIAAERAETAEAEATALRAKVTALEAQVARLRARKTST